MAAIITIDDIDQYRLGNLVNGPTTTRFTAAQEYALGLIAFGKDGKAYRYVQFVDAVAYASGHVVTRASATAWVVTNDRAGGSNITGHEVVGIVLGAPTVGQYGWVQVAGLAPCAGTYAAGDYLKPHATNDGEAVVSGYTAAKADFNIFAYALSAALVRLSGRI